MCVGGGGGIVREEDGRERTLLFAAPALRSLQDWQCSWGLVAAVAAGVRCLPIEHVSDAGCEDSGLNLPC